MDGAGPSCRLRGPRPQGWARPLGGQESRMDGAGPGCGAQGCREGTGSGAGRGRDGRCGARLRAEGRRATGVPQVLIAHRLPCLAWHRYLASHGVFYSVFKSSPFVIWDRKLEPVALGSQSGCVRGGPTGTALGVWRSLGVDGPSRAPHPAREGSRQGSRTGTRRQDRGPHGQEGDKSAFCRGCDARKRGALLLKKTGNLLACYIAPYFYFLY